MSIIAAPGGAVEDRASRAGPSGRTVLIVVIFAGLFATVGLGIYGLIDRHGPNLASTASYLPKQQLDHPVDRTLVGTVANPALTVEGDYVQVRTPQFSALALVTGPYVPGEGLPNQMSFDTCTWTISISHVAGVVPIGVADWDSIDHLGTVFKPYLVPGEPKPPSVLRTGQHLSFQLRAIMPVGEGLMRWAPNGNNIVAKWDYQVEND
jgi:hypothetical protein